MNRSSRLAALLAVLSAAAPVAGFAQPPATQPQDQQPQDQQPQDRQPPATQPQDQQPQDQQPPATQPQNQPPASQPQATATPAAQAPAAASHAPRTQVYYHSGAWDAFSGRAVGGGPVCGIGTNNPATGHTFSVRFDIGGTDTVFDANKPDWTIPDGMQVAVVMQIGANPAWTLHGTGHGQTIEWTMDRNAIQTFDQQFRAAGSMTLSYPDGNESPWHISLAGSTAVSDTFGRCVVDLTRQMQTARPSASGSQGAPAATQPFSQHNAGSASDATPAH
ncbi:hypothetical protein [Rhodopila sp.]|uniref:hypothetical protein n=1 Tax=Rhodopila sp. TaxID=2480087 RepID=UPI003D10E00B